MILGLAESDHQRSLTDGNARGKEVQSYCCLPRARFSVNQVRSPRDQPAKKDLVQTLNSR